MIRLWEAIKYLLSPLVAPIARPIERGQEQRQQRRLAELQALLGVATAAGRASQVLDDFGRRLVALPPPNLSKLPRLESPPLPPVRIPRPGPGRPQPGAVGMCIYPHPSRRSPA